MFVMNLRPNFGLKPASVAEQLLCRKTTAFTLDNNPISERNA